MSQAGLGKRSMGFKTLGTGFKQGLGMDMGFAGLCLGPGWIRLDWIWVYMDSACMGRVHGGLEFGWGLDRVWMGFIEAGSGEKGLVGH